MISARVVWWILISKNSSMTDVYKRDVDVPSLICLLYLRYFPPPVFAFGEGDAAGDGLTAGLGLITGAVPVVPAGEDDVDGEGLAVVGVFELFSGSVAQPATNAIESVATSSSAMRLIRFTFGLVIIFSSFEQD
jgi:hypothetical protein